MRTAKPVVTIAAVVVLATALAWSQVCDLNCAFYGCAKPAPVKSATTTHHCHEQPSEPTNPSHDDSQKCPGHVDAAATVPAAIAFHLSDAPLAQPLAVETFLPISLTLNHSSAALAALPLRSPPTLSALRI